MTCTNGVALTFQPSIIVYFIVNERCVERLYYDKRVREWGVVEQEFSTTNSRRKCTVRVGAEIEYVCVRAREIMMLAKGDK
jgi:hypothetical protein